MTAASEGTQWQSAMGELKARESAAETVGCVRIGRKRSSSKMAQHSSADV